jgi:hypothetical protein
LPKERSVRCGHGGLTDVVEEGKSGPRADAECRPLGSTDGFVVVGIAARQGVGHGVKATRTVLDGEIKAKELADPLMMWHRRQPLVQ